MDEKQNQGQQSEGAQGQDQPGQQTPQGSPEFDRDREEGTGTEGERNQGGGISNRDLDRELEEQEELPERGSQQSER